MISVKHKDINNPVFVDALKTLVNTPFSIKTSYHVGRIQDKIVQVSNAARTQWQELVKTRVEWVETDGQKIPKAPEDLKQLEKEFLDIDVIIGKWSKIHVQDIHMAKLTPLQIMALEPILEGFETLEDGGENEKAN